MSNPLSNSGAQGAPPPNSTNNANPVPPHTAALPGAGSSQNPVQTANHGERYWLILENNVEWLRFAETKASIILTCYGVLFTIVYTNANDVFKSVESPGLIRFFVILFALASLTSIVSAFLAVRPRLKNKNPTSILYFRHINEQFKDATAYKHTAHRILDDEDKYTDHLTEQIHSISRVANSKYVCTGVSVWAFGISLAILVIAVAAYVISKLQHP